MTVWHMHLAGLTHNKGSEHYLRAVVLRFSVPARSSRAALERIDAWASANGWSIQNGAEHLSFAVIATVDLVTPATSDTQPPAAGEERAA